MLAGRHIKQMLSRRWNDEGGYRELLKVAFPLIMSMGALSVQHFVDRMFLTWYSPEAIAAATPAGILNYTVMSLFIGTATYVSTFVAQYNGAGGDDRIGPSIWQGLYMSITGGAALLLFIPLSGVIFNLVGHSPGVRDLEIEYFRVLCLGAAPMIASSTLSAFFSGRGKTWPVMWVNIIGTAVNVILDYTLIFGHFGFPEMGIAGAGIATVSSFTVTCVIYMLLVSRPVHRRKYRTLSGWRFDAELFGRLMRYGFPNGMQLFLDVSGYTVFVFLIGRLGMAELAATNITLNVNTIAFMPMLGLGMAISILVGQKVGAGTPTEAEKSVYSGFHISMLYMVVISMLYVLIPGVFIAPYIAGAEGLSFEHIFDTVVVLLRFVALYSLFDAMAIVFASGIKGAGDTRFVMISIVLLSWTLLVIPTYLALVVFHTHMYAAWGFVCMYIAVLGITFLVRFRGGKWKTMRVIEYGPLTPPVSLPETPAIEFEPR